MRIPQKKIKMSARTTPSGVIGLRSSIGSAGLGEVGMATPLFMMESSMGSRLGWSLEGRDEVLVETEWGLCRCYLGMNRDVVNAEAGARNGRCNIELMLNASAGGKNDVLVKASDGGRRQPRNGKCDGSLLVAAIGGEQAEVVVNLAIGSNGVKFAAVGEDAHEDRLAQANGNGETGGVDQEKDEDDDALAVAKADAAIPLLLFDEIA